MADWGMKIAKDGASTDSSTPADYDMWSKYPMLKVKTSGSATQSLVISGGTGSFDITIDADVQSFTPIVFLVSDVYNPLSDSVLNDRHVPYQASSSTGLLSCLYGVATSSGALKYFASVVGGTDGTYALDYEYIICYDKFDV